MVDGEREMTIAIGFLSGLFIGLAFNIWQGETGRIPQNWLLKCLERTEWRAQKPK